MRYTPVDKDEAASIIGEGIHTGLRKGTDAAGSGDAWRAIAAPESGWSDAIGFFMWGLDYMGMALCKAEKDEGEPPMGSVVLVYGPTGTAHQRHHLDGLWHDTAGRVYTWENLLRLDASGRAPLVVHVPDPS